MAYIRRLPPQKWNAVVRLPNGKRRSLTHPLRKVVADWAKDIERDNARGVTRDPKAGRITVGEWHERWRATRLLEPSTLAGYESRWRTHIEPVWKTVPLNTITRTDVQAWVRAMVDAGVGPRVVQQSVAVLSSLLAVAVAENLIPANPAARLKLPRAPKPPDRYLDRDVEFPALLAALTQGRDRLLVDFACHTGLRWGELTGLRASRINWLRGIVHVVDVWTPAGRREYPKRRASRRDIPLPEHLKEPLRQMYSGPEDFLFAADGGQPLHEANWRNRVWVPALKTAGINYLPIHAMRHTAASWLVMDGVDLFRVQALLGHESITTTMRYAHLAPAAFDQIQASWKGRQNDVDPPVTHGLQEGDTG